MAWGDFFGGSNPTWETETRQSWRGRSGSLGPAWQTQERRVAKPGSSGGWGGGRNPLDDLLKGFDKESAALTDKLKTIYDGYTGSYEELEGKVSPIMDLIEQDIGKFEDYIGDYEGLISGMEGDFLDSIIIDPSATRTRGEYMGNVAAQYDQAQAAQRRQAIQQGINPYANRGAQRSMALDRAGAMAGAANQAYGDWRDQYNTDIQRQQQANAMYADLFGQKGQMYGDLLRARGGLLEGHRGLHDSKLAAEMARAGGYEGLLGMSENRRQQALDLGKWKSEMDFQRANMFNQMKEAERGWYNPDYNAGGGYNWS